MDEVAGLARSGAAEGTTLIADFQTAGRGRHGRAWNAPAGTSLTFSTLLRPRLRPDELTPLALLTAASVAEAIEATTGLCTQVKWPNDLLCRDRKLCGILVRVTPEQDGQSQTVVLGIGLNVNIPTESLPPGATGLLVELGRQVDREQLLQAALETIGTMYGALTRRDHAVWWRRATARLAYVGEVVTVRDEVRERCGRLIGVASDGSLLLRTEVGETLQLSAGELVRGPRPLHGGVTAALSPF